jgi:predicted SprT family Zn-dependent metalloprotease
MDLMAAYAIAFDSMEKHGLIEQGWRFHFSRAKTILGQCFHCMKRIYLSKAYVEANAEADIRNTILHEIAHALVGPDHNHDMTWKLKAIEVGARPEVCGRSHIEMPKGKYVGVCVGCGYEEHRHRKPKYINTEGMYSHIECKRMGKPSKIEWRKA